MKRMACVVALAVGTGLPLAISARSAMAEPAPFLTAGELQISLDAPSVVAGDTDVKLDMFFHGANVRSVELYIDGKLVKHQAMHTAGDGKITFALDGTLLAEGNHLLLVKAFDVSGSVATATTRLRVAETDENSLVKFQSPKRNAIVQGVVPIQVAVASSAKNPFVSFFVDDEFLSLTNFAPFTYNWDSTKLANGTHKFTVIAYDGETAAEIQTVHLQFHVNNPGGFTTRETETPDLRNTKSVNARVAHVPAAATHSSATAHALASTMDTVTPPAMSETQRILDVLVPQTQMARTTAENDFAGTAFAVPTTAHLTRSLATTSMIPGATLAVPMSPGTVNWLKAGLARTMEATGFAYDPAVAAPSASLMSIFPKVEAAHTESTPGAGISAPTVWPTTPNASLTHGTAVIATQQPQSGVLGLLADPAQIASLTAPAPSRFRLARMAARPRRAGNIAALPGLTFQGAHANPTRASYRALPQFMNTLAGSGDLHHFTGKSFDVAFDNTQIVFDVPPRVEHGMPLAPFRAIFEHTGGTLAWYGHSKTVRAVNETREIEIHIGNAEAKVNNQAVKMEAKPYIDRGRTIVPLSFVRDALNVEVQYDPATGHLRINSKK